MTFRRFYNRKTSPKRKYPVLGQVWDFDNDLWDIRDARATKHGFDLLFGSPVYRLANDECGLPRLITTKELLAYWERNKAKHDGILYDLPAGRSTLKRARRRLGLHYYRDRDRFWKERIEELKNLPAREVAARNNIGMSVVVESRRRLLGNRARPLDWWRTPHTLEILRSKITLREIGEKLGIGTSHAHRLRDRARLILSETGPCA
jgi:hypothetical protein